MAVPGRAGVARLKNSDVAAGDGAGCADLLPGRLASHDDAPGVPADLRDCRRRRLSFRHEAHGRQALRCEGRQQIRRREGRRDDDDIASHAESPGQVVVGGEHHHGEPQAERGCIALGVDCLAAGIDQREAVDLAARRQCIHQAPHRLA